MPSWKARGERNAQTTNEQGLTLRSAPRKELEDLARQGKLWAIVDACDEPAVPTKMDELGEQRAICLYRGEAEVENADIAPFLAHVDDFLLRWIVEELWARPWGVFAVTSGEIEKLRAHFRQFLTVRDPDGEKMYFRYYDPRVLKAFLPACNRDELSKLFGPLEAYVLTEPDRDDVTFLTRQGAEAGRRASSTPPGPRRWG